jgi:hypothetical protein
VWPRHRYLVNQAQAFLTNPVWPWPRSHQVNRAPSLPRNPVPVLRTNNQRSRVVASCPRHGRTLINRAPSLPRNPVWRARSPKSIRLPSPTPVLRTNNQESRVVWLHTVAPSQSSSKPSSQPSAGPSNKPIKGVVLWPRRHEQVPKISTNLVLAYKTVSSSPSSTTCPGHPESTLFYFGTQHSRRIGQVVP